jgi:hypothetical protein
MEVDGVLKSTVGYLVLQKTRPEKRNAVYRIRNIAEQAWIEIP